jgi:O-antigen/teichoic acid export membrane protein
LLRTGVKGQAGNILQFFNYRLDTFVLNYYQGAGAVGIYGVAVSVAEILWQFPNAVGFVIFPKAAASRARDLNGFTPRVFKTTLLVTAAGATLLVLGGQTFIRHLYSSAFDPAYVPLLALLPGVVLLGGAKVLAFDMAGRGYLYCNSVVSGTVFAITVVLDILLIPRWGAVGAAVASSIAYSTSLLLSSLLYRIVASRAFRTDGQIREAAWDTF